MPRGSPFTALCQSVVRVRPRRADLHTHTTASDGLFTPAEVVRRALAACLGAVAITDHDTLAGLAPARQAAAGQPLEVVSGVEMTAVHNERELHLLGYFFDADDTALNAALADVRDGRRQRYDAMRELLRDRGIVLSVAGCDADSPGRRHLAEQMVAEGFCSTIGAAFFAHLGTPEFEAIPLPRLPAAEAIALVRNAGGVVSWAHPPEECDATAAELKALGLQALECEYPWADKGRGRRLRRLAGRYGLAVSGGSDCHGPAPVRRAIGARSIGMDEVAIMRALRNGGCSADSSPSSSAV